jgi:hypothetical protein
MNGLDATKSLRHLRATWLAALTALSLVLGHNFPALAGGVDSPITRVSSPIIFSAKPELVELIGQREVGRGQTISIEGRNLSGLAKVYLGDQLVQFSVLSDSRASITIPRSAIPGDASITLEGEFGKVELTNFVTISAVDFALSSKVTIGSFNGYVAIYTKNLEGRLLSMKVGSRWRVVSEIPSGYTLNLVKIGRGKNLETKVYIDRQLVKIRNLIVR